VVEGAREMYFDAAKALKQARKVNARVKIILFIQYTRNKKPAGTFLGGLHPNITLAHSTRRILI
jgi:hypothetical protein